MILFVLIELMTTTVKITLTLLFNDNKIIDL